MTHQHTHNHTPKSNIGLAFAMNLSFTVIEIIGGMLTNSVAILSDAVHDLGDSLALALAWYFQRLSRRGSTPQYTYGYKRFSLLGAIINSIVLVVGSIYILMETVPRIFHPQATSAEGMFLLAVLGIVVNGAAVLRTRKARSINERVVSLHLLEDVLGWAAVLVGSALMYFTGWTVIDPILSLVVACYVLWNVFKNVRAVMPILMQGVPESFDRAVVAAALAGVRDVAGVHDLHIWSLDEEYNILTVHVVVARSMTMPELASLKGEIRTAMHSLDIEHATIEFELANEDCSFSECVV